MEVSTVSGTEYIEINLGNVSDGELERQFCEEVAKVMDVKANLHEYAEKGSTVSCKVTMECEFVFHIETGAILVSTSANFKAPKRRGITRAVFMRDGQTLVENAVQQNLLDTSNVTQIESAKEGTNNDA